MSKFNVSDNTSISMPIRNMLAIIGAVAVGVWAYFGVVEQLGLFNSLELEVHDLQGVPFRLPGQQPAIGSSHRERRDIE